MCGVLLQVGEGVKMMAKGQMQPAKLELNPKVKVILERGGFLPFLEKFDDPEPDLDTKLAEFWNGSHVEANSAKFRIL